MALPFSNSQAIQYAGLQGPGRESMVRTNTCFRKAVRLSCGSGPLDTTTAVPGQGATPTEMVAIGKIFSLSAPVSSVTSAATTVGVQLVPLTLNPEGKDLSKLIRVICKGHCAANTDNKEIQLVWGSQSATILNAASNGLDFAFEAAIYVTGASAQEVAIAGFANGAFLSGLSFAGTQSNSTAINVGVTLTAATAAADIVLTELTILAEAS
jgi:hypothetical protein